MKSLLSGLLIISSLQIANAASTDTVTLPIVVTAEPIEAKVVEIRIFKKAPEVIETRSKKRIKTLPLGHGTCSGAFVSSNGDILTAKHCVDQPADYEVLTSDGQNYTGIVVATSPVHDLALIHIDRRNTAKFELAETVTRGQTVFILGSPLGIPSVLSTGIVARIDGDSTLLDCSALPGNSGGPVFDNNQKMVGIITSINVVMLGLTHLSRAQGSDAVHFFLKKALVEGK